MTTTRTVLATALACLTLIAGLVVAPVATAPATALPITAGPRILTLGDSITWQACGGPGQLYPAGAPDYLEQRDGGCHGWSGATTAEMIYQMQGGRFVSGDSGQPHPFFPDRGMFNPYNVQEAYDRAEVIVIGLGTNDSNRQVGCGTRTVSPWPVQIPRDPAIGPRDVPCKVSPAEFRASIDYFVWRAAGKPVFWYDLAVTNAADPAARDLALYNNEIWAAAGRHANFHPIAWQRNVTARPDYLRDGVHMSEAGGYARYNLLIDAMRGCGIR